MHGTARDFVRVALFNYAPRRRVVELGSRDVNGSIRDLFPRAVYTGVDRLAGPNVDVVGDAATYLPEQAPDTVVCVSVLEHAEEGERIMRNAYDMLQTGGLLLCTTVSAPCPPHSGFDGGPLRAGEFYRDIHPSLLFDWLRPFRRVILSYEIAYSGDVFAIAEKL